MNLRKTINFIRTTEVVHFFQWKFFLYKSYHNSSGLKGARYFTTTKNPPPSHFFFFIVLEDSQPLAPVDGVNTCR